MSYDAVVVGGRCAGAPLAQFLARAGKKVVIVDSADLPTDQPMSTHFVQAYGMKVLEDLGLAPARAAHPARRRGRAHAVAVHRVLAR